jgi:hypothetical protein
MSQVPTKAQAKTYPDPRYAPDPNIEAPPSAPSQYANNKDQINQPTGHGIAGGKVPPVGEPGNELAPNTEGMVGVTLNNNYSPLDRYTVVSMPNATAPAGSGRKILAGSDVWLPIVEAKKLVDDGRATYLPVRL